MWGNKGVTPVIATVLLLMMTVGAAGAAYVWMSSLQSTIQEEVAGSASIISQKSSLQAGIRFKQCNSTETGGIYSHNEVVVVIENTGSSTIKKGNIGLTVRDENGNDIEFVENQDAMSTDLKVNEFQQINFNLTTDIVYGQNYILKFSLPSGVTTTTICTGTT